MSAPTNTAHTSAAIPMIKVLGIVSLLCGVLIVITQITTLGRIRHNQELLMRESVEQLLPGIQKQIIYGVEPSGDLKNPARPRRRRTSLLRRLRRFRQLPGRCHRRPAIAATPTSFKPCTPTHPIRRQLPASR